MAGPRGQCETRGNLPETGSCSAPNWPNTPEGLPAAPLVPRWHVTNGDMLLFPCFVRLMALIEINAVGISDINISARRGADSRAALLNAQINENQDILL